MNITYYGHSCLYVEGNGRRVIIDPFLTGNQASRIKPSDIAVDAVILTHGHDDHFGDCLEIAEMNHCPIIATFELAMFCQRKGAAVHAMNIGGAYSFDGFRIKWTPAFHGSSVRDGEQLLYAGQPAGVLLTMGSYTLYHCGDTALFSDMKMIGEMNRIDVAAIPIGDNYTMGPDDALLAAQWIGAKHVIPTHYNTFPIIKQNAESFVHALGSFGIIGHAMKSREVLQLAASGDTFSHEVAIEK